MASSLYCHEIVTVDEDTTGLSVKVRPGGVTSAKSGSKHLVSQAYRCINCLELFVTKEVCMHAWRPIPCTSIYLNRSSFSQEALFKLPMSKLL